VSPTALALVVAAAVLHAGWNVQAKRSAEAGAVFLWLVDVVTAVVWAPLALGVALAGGHLGGDGLAFAAGSAALHVGYFLVLQLGYRLGDLSIVYPLARGAGPLLATAGAVVLLDERPSGVALSGAVLVAAGVLVLAHSGGRTAGPGSGWESVGAGLVTGAFIAVYTLWDAQAVTAVAVSPVLYGWVTGLGETLLLAPVAARRRATVRAIWRRHRSSVLAVAVMAPLAYLLVLVALTRAPVSAVAPAREMSIVIGAVLGGSLLGEADARRRVAASLAVLAGVAALAVG
jgi:drug/metabolite transporter (DMT)-like permease